jgi:Domain of unknown function (DUF4440)
MMHIILRILAAGLMLSVPVAWGQDSVAAPRAAVERQVLDVQARRFQAIVEADVETLEDILADDLTYTHTTGKIDSKREFLDALKSRKVNYHSIEPADVLVRVYDDTALLTGLADMSVSTPERSFSFSCRFTEVYRKKNGDWQLVAWQSTRLPE